MIVETARPLEFKSELNYHLSKRYNSHLVQQYAVLEDAVQLGGRREKISHRNVSISVEIEESIPVEI